MPTTNQTLAIVIPVWNNWIYTKRALSDLRKLPDDHKIIIVDNGSTDETKDLTEDGICIVRNATNLGFAKACNAGFAKAVQLGFENVMFLNNDIRVQHSFDSWTQPVIAAAKRGSIAGPTVGCLDKDLGFICEASKWPSRGYGYLSGWNITASVNVWNQLVLENHEGPFSIEFGLAYFEDTDLGLRAREQNIPCEVVPVPVNHLGKATSKKLGLSGLYQHAKPIFMNKWKERV
jgi:GT2 family glycosyltransferase